jgi:hypothetical protein
MEHVCNPDRPNGELVSRGNPNGVALDIEGHVCRVVDFDDCVASRVDKGEVSGIRSVDVAVGKIFNARSDDL